MIFSLPPLSVNSCNSLSNILMPVHLIKETRKQTLSEERAGAVKAYLIENGIASDRLTSKGFGESKPIDTNKTAKGKANNRRVEVLLVK